MKTSPHKAFTGLRAQSDGRSVSVRFYLTTPRFLALKALRESHAVRIYRRRESRFTFGADYAEYFDGLRPARADKVFEGRLPAINKRKFEFIDSDVRKGRVYSYWVSSDQRDAPTGPAAVKIRDTEVWWPYAVVEDRVKAIAAANPELAVLFRCGKTVRGRTLLGVVIGRGRKTLALVGAIHPGESGPEFIVPALERLLAEEPRLLRKVRIAALPSVNPDERERLVRGVPWYLRLNANGVDLNRNFAADWKAVDRMYGFVSDDPDALTYRGRSPGSEPETRAVVRFMKRVQPAAVFSYHCLASIAGCSFLCARAARGDRAYAAECSALLTPYTRGYHADRRRKGRMGYVCTPGSFPAWAYRHGGIPCFDVEGNSSIPGIKAACRDRTTRKTLREYQEYHYHGIAGALRSLAGVKTK